MGALSALIQNLSARADSRWWLGRQDKVELIEQDFVVRHPDACSGLRLNSNKGT
jgi:hypothetical protein